MAEFISQPVHIHLPKSKSISNRLLVLKHLYAPQLSIQYLSEARDTQILASILGNSALPCHINVQDAGTVARFVSALACLSGKRHEIYGTKRMHERPMGELIEALRSLGARITETEKKNCLPLVIESANLKSAELSMSTEESSQFLSALMMIAPKIPGGITIELKGHRHSWPYVEMTAAVMCHIGLNILMTDDKIVVAEQEGAISGSEIQVEADWSSAAFFWQALSNMPVGSAIFFPGLKPADASLQGDAVLMQWQGLGGVYWETMPNGMLAVKRDNAVDYPSLDFSGCPDLAIPVVLGLASLGCAFSFKGLQTLDLKESKRLTVLLDWLDKAGVEIKRKQGFFTLSSGKAEPGKLEGMKTYQDHRLIMALAVLLRVNEVEFNEKEAVSKSFPAFWEQLRKLHS